MKLQMLELERWQRSRPTPRRAASGEATPAAHFVREPVQVLQRLLQDRVHASGDDREGNRGRLVREVERGRWSITYELLGEHRLP